MILSRETQEKASLIVAQLVAFRKTLRGASEDDIARKLGFDDANGLHAQLRVWELPEWLVTGYEGAEKPKPPKPPPPERTARSSGPITELPPADAAAPLFREKLEALIRATEDLEHRKEKLQGKRFIQSAVYRDPVYFSRDFVSDEQWQYIRDHFGLDPKAKEYMYFIYVLRRS